MDAIDVAWCLGCNRHIDGTAAYCSLKCHNDHAAMSALRRPPSFRHHSPPSPSPFQFASSSSLSADDFDDDLDEDYIHLSLDHPLPTTSKSSWVGKGTAGIHAWARDIPPGPPSTDSDIKPPPSIHTFRPPKLILSQKKPLPPTLCMSKNTPTPPEPSLPILTPQQSLPPLSSLHSMTEASLTSLTTALSSLSLATPASPASDGHLAGDPPSAETQKPLTLMGNLTAHLRSWASSSHHNDETKPKVRPPTVSQRPFGRTPAVAGFESALPPYQRPVSSFFPSHSPFPSLPEKPRSMVEKEFEGNCPLPRSRSHYPQSLRPEDHPVFLLRGRKAARIHS